MPNLAVMICLSSVDIQSSIIFPFSSSILKEHPGISFDWAISILDNATDVTSSFIVNTFSSSTEEVGSVFSTYT